ncbi:trypsin-like serine protease [Apilactobacillus kunkeei DSM 12361 = ATCC 700308]|uniref:Trypsin-like serine protease n=1 Tax=Apilactobacillus kunkeei DSM 12361 = ATCC 700308 TaxID=1423768 RepID=A0A0R1FWP9_9LACO|nr:trypsin-like peptidase domain-containing protein [Apilactobacillus kunkeei]KOY75096.1 Trypsin-like serine protease with PDZ domain [Apilactobacillus kunkeei DSM 12361 = ATCC 700308]KRK23031.1 trypsin-like serine protease [Apilactobacillus kunkeei DSM 12361 = ATCC 700308]QYU53127.1 trypsin-like peptidase domain-containing protein [Apilactobacillus kunkeei]TMS99513.1 PDZ domain-containing protein [Apilactobacillus kunkeei]
MKKSDRFVLKTGLIALVAGLLGGGIAYGGASLLQSTGVDVAVPTGSNAGGTASTSNLKVNVQSQSEKAYQAVKNSVVSVINLKSTSSSSFDSMLGKSSSKLEANSEGSGVIYKKSGNAAYIVTNNHVVSGASAIQVLLSNGKQLEAKVVGTDSVTDLAVLKINGSMIKSVASFGNSDNIKVGETSLAIGSPLGSAYASSLTQGIISAKKREVPLTGSNGQATGNTATVIQTDTAINPGNSGGPLINLAGQVIGINSMKLASDSEGTSVEGIGFAIPSNEVVNIINQLVKNGKIERPALGIQYVDLTNIAVSQQKSILKLPSSVENGVVVYTVTKNSPAENAGLKKYDVIVELAGKKISSQDEVKNILYSQKLGSTVSVKYYRDGKLKTGSIKLTESTSQLKINQ